MALPEDPLAGSWMLDPPPRLARPRVVWPVPVDPRGGDGPTPRQARGPRWRRTARSLYLPADATGDQPAQRIVEAAGHLPSAGGAVTGWASLHLAGARWFEGIDARGDALPVPLALGPAGAMRARPGVVVQRRTFATDEVVLRHGVPCLEIHRAVIDEMCSRHDLRSAVAVLEMAMHAELTCLTWFRDWLASSPRFPGKRLVRQAAALAVEGAESPQEVLMRLVWELDAGLPRPLSNRPVYSLEGRFLARPDLFDPGAGMCMEYDGEHHRRARARSRDLVREEELRHHGLEYLSVVAGELRDPAVVRRMQQTRRRALASTRPRRWTISPPSGAPPELAERMVARAAAFGRPR